MRDVRPRDLERFPEGTVVETLEKQVRRASRRLMLQSLGVKLAWCWFTGLLIAAVAIGVGKYWVPPTSQELWAATWLVVALAGGLVAAATWTAVRRQTTLAAALEFDRRFGLKERVSSTLALDNAARETDVGRALARDAEQRVRGLDVAECFRLRLDRRALLPVVPAVAVFALVALVPVRVPPAPAKAAARQATPVKQATKALVKRLEAQKKDALEKGLPEAEAIAKLEDGVRKLSETKENDRKQTLLELNDLVKDAQARREELAGSADLKKQLANLKNLQQGPAEALGQALKNGELDKALKELDKLKQQMAAGKLDPEGQKALAEQLEQLEQQLAKKSEAHKKLTEQLKEQMQAARRDGNREAADKLQEQLDKLAAQQPQTDKMGAMAAQLKQAAECLGEGNCEQAAEALEQLGEQVAGMQENLQEMDAIDAALEGVADCKQMMACQNCDGGGCDQCQGDQWKKTYGELSPFAQRGGGKGIGVGLGPGLGDETNPDGKFYDSAVRQQPGRGAAKVVGEAVGPNRKGSVRQEIQTEFATAEQSSADALSEQRLPRDYRDHAQKYFDSLREGKQ